MSRQHKNTLTTPFSEELQQSEARFRAMFENAAVGIGILSLDRRLLDANQALCEMFGIPRAELVGQTPAIVTHPEDYAQSTADFQDLISGAQDTYWSERRYMRKNGEVFWAHVTMNIVRNAQGVPLYLVGMVIDIDDRVRATQELQESEERFRATFESSAIGMGLLGLDGKILKVNAAVCKMSGYTAEELQQRYDHQNVFPADREVGADFLADLLAGKREFYEVEKRYVRKSGEVFWTRLTLSAVRNPEGSAAYLVGMIEDIDEQKQILAELRESEERFRAVFDSASVGVALMGLNRQIQAVNKAAQQLTGYTEEELQTIPTSFLAVEEDRDLDRDLFQELREGLRSQYTVEKRYIRKSGRIFWGRVNFSSVRDPLGKPLYLVGLIEDITEEKQAAERLAAQEAEYRRTLEERIAARTAELNQAVQLLQEKAAQEAVALERTRLARELHDAVTQTLFSASLIAEVLPELWAIDAEEARKTTEELRQLTRGALAEMRTLLLELRPAVLTQARFSDLLRQLCEALIGRARLPIEINIQGERELPPDVQVALYRIAQESLNNVAKYARATQVSVALDLSAAGARLEIVDNGTGYDPALLKPTSLGMRIMRERAEAIAAEIQFTSAPGAGTTVAVTWHDHPAKRDPL